MITLFDVSSDDTFEQVGLASFQSVSISKVLLQLPYFKLQIGHLTWLKISMPLGNGRQSGRHSLDTKIKCLRFSGVYGTDYLKLDRLGRSEKCIHEYITIIVDT